MCSNKTQSHTRLTIIWLATRIAARRQSHTPNFIARLMDCAFVIGSDSDMQMQTACDLYANIVCLGFCRKANHNCAQDCTLLKRLHPHWHYEWFSNAKRQRRALSDAISTKIRHRVPCAETCAEEEHGESVAHPVHWMRKGQSSEKMLCSSGNTWRWLWHDPIRMECLHAKLLYALMCITAPYVLHFNFFRKIVCDLRLFSATQTYAHAHTHRLLVRWTSLTLTLMLVFCIWGLWLLLKCITTIFAIYGRWDCGLDSFSHKHTAHIELI